MHKRLIGCVAGACALTLAASGQAIARAGDRTAAETYPVATDLCQRAAAGNLGARLEASRSQVLADCDALVNAYGPLVSTVDAAESQELATIAAQRSLVASACAKPVADRAACQAARATAITTDGAARTTLRTAVLAYHTAVENNRQTFWSAIEALHDASPPAPATTS